MSINKIEIQDGGGNVYYPKTSIDSVVYSDNTSIEEKIRILEYRLNELKGQLANSINNKTGSSLTSNSTVDEMTVAINSIKTLEQATADANATAGNILVDKTAYVNGAKITGTMPNKGAVTASLNCGGSYTIPAGYHNGSGKVTANSLASQTGANATAGDILKDKTAWVNGSKLTGTIDNHGAITAGNSIVQSGDKLYCRMPRGAYLTNASSGYPEISYPQGDVAAALGLTADKIAAGNTIAGITGTYKSSNDIWAYTPGTIDLPTERENTTIVSIPFEPSIVIAFSSTETGKHYSTTNPLGGDIRWGNGSGSFFKIMSGNFAVKHIHGTSNRTCINDVTYSNGKLTIYSKGSYGGSDYRYTFMIIAIK